jgi:hypothetical protein
MPISSSDFEKSNRDPSILLQEFLRFNYRTAYNLGELVEMLTSKGKNSTGEDAERLLSALEYGGKVKSREINGETYYQHSEIMGFKKI